MSKVNLSTFNYYVDEKPFGQHLEVCALVSGAFSNIPPQPRYMVVWNVELVSNYIKSKWKDNKNLPGK